MVSMEKVDSLKIMTCRSIGCSRSMKEGYIYCEACIKKLNENKRIVSGEEMDVERCRMVRDFQVD